MRLGDLGISPLGCSLAFPNFQILGFRSKIFWSPRFAESRRGCEAYEACKNIWTRTNVHPRYSSKLNFPLYFTRAIIPLCFNMVNFPLYLQWQISIFEIGITKISEFKLRGKLHGKVRGKVGGKEAAILV